MEASSRSSPATKCFFPTLSDGFCEASQSQFVAIEDTPWRKPRVLNENDQSIENILQLSWAIVLRAYAGTDHVCFYVQGVASRKQASSSLCELALLGSKTVAQSLGDVGSQRDSRVTPQTPPALVPTTNGDGLQKCANTMVQFHFEGGRREKVQYYHRDGANAESNSFQVRH